MRCTLMLVPLKNSSCSSDRPLKRRLAKGNNAKLSRSTRRINFELNKPRWPNFKINQTSSIKRSPVMVESRPRTRAERIIAPRQP